MLAPDKLLAVLLGTAVATGGLVQGIYWKNTGTPENSQTLLAQLRQARDEIDLLSRENESLRSLAQGGGTLHVDPEWIARVESEFDLRFISSPVVHRIAAEELRNRISAAYESGFGPAGIDDRQEAYRRIGWLTADDDLLAQLTLSRSFNSLSWFDQVTGDAWVTDRFDPEEIPHQATLLHLLTRILLNQHFPPPPAYPGDDAARVREALHMGTAAGAESRYLAASARDMGFVPLTENIEAEQIITRLPPLIRGLRQFPLTEGKGLADSLFVQGNSTLHDALRAAPQTTRAILDPTPTPESLTLPATPEDPYLTESAGMLGLRLWLPPESAQLATHWTNDRYLLVPDGEMSTAVIWDIVLDSQQAADQLQTAALANIATRSGKPATLGTVSPTAENRLLRISRPSPTRVRFLNAATETLCNTIP